MHVLAHPLLIDASEDGSLDILVMPQIAFDCLSQPAPSTMAPTRSVALTSQLSKEAETHQRNLEEIREACRIIREECMVPRSQAEDERYKAEVSRLSAALASLREERKELQSQIDALVTLDAGEAAEL